MKLIFLLFVYINIFLITGCSQQEMKDGEIVRSQYKGVDIHSKIPSKENLKKESIKKYINMYQVNSKDWRIEPTSEANKRIVLLTIDDAPDKYGVEMARILTEMDVKAIFFVNGHFIQSKTGKEDLRTIHRLGHMIGNHTMNHYKLNQLDVKQAKREIIDLNMQIENIIGEKPVFFRAPFGINTKESLAVAKKENMIVMNWTYGYDWEEKYQTKDTLSEIMVNSPHLINGANILLHDREWTKKALSDIVKGLKEKGYEIIDPYLIKSF